MSRIILHCDLDCFFAAVEERDNPELKGKPIIIGADPKGGNGRGVVSTCNYEARKYGLRSATPISKAYKLCPHGVYLRPNSKKYYEVSDQVMDIIKTYSPTFEQVGIDEAYLDVSDICNNYYEAKKHAIKLKREIFNTVGITLSVGIGSTKSIAKIASDYEKPNGITVVEPSHIQNFLKDLEITRIPGIGKKSKFHYNKFGIYVIGDIIKTPLNKITKKFGKYGEWIWKIANGLDDREVKEFHEDRKSISAERTFFEDTEDFKLILSKLDEINNKIHKKLEIEKIYYRTITLKIRLKGFLTYTRSKSFSYPILNKKKVLETVLELLNEFLIQNKKVRLVGIKLSNFERDINIKQTNLTNYLEI
ncbi:MAG: DNA polymerase IV [Promethearchaeota archaeon]